MDLSTPMQSVIPSAHGAVLVVLSRTDEPLTGRGVAELTRPKFGYRRVTEVLGQLAEAGVVVRETRPPSHLYRLNNDHVAAEGIRALAGMWAGLLERIRADLSHWPIPPLAAWLFGSAARGEATAASDIDVLLVRPAGATSTAEALKAWRYRSQALADSVRVWSGNACEILDLDLPELDAAVERDDRLVRDLRDQAIVLVGTDTRTLLRPKKRVRSRTSAQLDRQPDERAAEQPSGRSPAHVAGVPERGEL